MQRLLRQQDDHQHDDQDGHRRSVRPKATNMTIPAIIPTSSDPYIKRNRDQINHIKRSLSTNDGFVFGGHRPSRAVAPDPGQSALYFLRDV
jgi:hypothetical protein